MINTQTIFKNEKYDYFIFEMLIIDLLRFQPLAKLYFFAICKIQIQGNIFLNVEWMNKTCLKFD